jgi:hypothetical protein
MKFLQGQTVIVSSKGSRYFQQMGKIKRLGRTPGNYIIEFNGGNKEQLMYEYEIASVPDTLVPEQIDESRSYLTIILFKNEFAKEVETVNKPKINWGNEIFKIEFDDFEIFYPIDILASVSVKSI